MNDLLVDVFRFAHFIGLAALFGGLIVQFRSKERRATAPVLWGAVTQLVSGMALLMLTIEDANHLKVAVKLLIVVVVLVLAILFRKKTMPLGVYVAVFALTITNTALAVFW